MKRLIHLALVIVLLVSVCIFGVQPIQAAESSYRNNADAMLETEFGQKIDLNNTNVRRFRQLRGFYPDLAAKIVSGAPYKKVEDVLNLPGLTAAQKQRLQANLDKFTVVEATDVFVEGAERLNNGIYD